MSYKKTNTTQKIRSQGLTRVFPDRFILELTQRIAALSAEINYGYSEEVNRRTAEIIKALNDKRHEMGWRVVQ